MSQPQTKTILEWFEEARAAGHEWADAAIENARAAKMGKTHADSPQSALSAGFVWRRTAQGQMFWEDVYSSLRQNP